MLQVMSFSRSLAHSECSINTSWKQSAPQLNHSDVGGLEGESALPLTIFMTLGK